MSNDKTSGVANPTAEVAELEPIDPALNVFTHAVKDAQTVFLGIKFGKEKEYIRANKSDVVSMAEKRGVPSTEVRGKFLFVHP